MKILLHLTLLVLCMPCFGQLSLIKKNESCAGLKNGSIEAKLAGIDGPFQYQWEDLTNQVMLPETTAVITNLKPGKYSVTVTVDGQCMDSKAAIVWPGKTVSLTISSQHVSHTPNPIPCGIRPEVTFLLTAQATGGTPPYYCSWNKGGDTEGTCTKQVTGKDFDETIFVIDSNGCVEQATWTYHTLVKICPKDPNDISGPDGYGEPRWVSVDDPLNYTIRFENDPIFATAAAGVVLVTLPIDDDVDPFSFRLGTIGFGNQIIEIPANKSSLQERYDFSSTIGYFVDVTAGLDIPNNRFFWILETIDPLTGQPPIDPTAGFLPVNDTLTGSGEGFITFVCKPKPATATGELIEKQASIIFDANDPIMTNTWINKVDAIGPTTTPDVMPDTFYTNTIPFSWIVNDDPGGCGVKQAEIMLSQDGIDFETNGFIVDSNHADLVLDWNRKYYFRVVGTDFVDNQELPAYDSFYIIPHRAIEFITPDQDVYCIGDSLFLQIQLTSLASVDISYSLDSGAIFIPLASGISSFPLAIALDSAFLHPHIILRARNETSDLEAISDPFRVNALPVVDAGFPVIGCDNEILLVEATGTNQYHWWPDSIMGTPFNRYSNLYAHVSQYAYVFGTDVYGCSNMDSVYLTIHPAVQDTLGTALCEGDSLFINNEWITAEGFYPTVYSTIYGCDSTLVADVYFESPCHWSGGPYVFVDEDATGDNNGTSWEDAFNELSDAIYVAGRYENVQEIWVAEGVYFPHPSRRDTSFILRDSIKIFGGFLGVESTRDERTSNAELVFLSGDINVPDTLWDNSYHTLQINPACVDCRVDGVTIQYGYADQPGNAQNIGAGVLCQGKAQLTNVIFERNLSTDQGAALHASGAGSNLVIEGCTFRLNTSSLGKDVVNLAGAQIEFKGANSIH